MPDKFQHALEQLELQSLHRQLRVVDSTSTDRTFIQGQSVLLMASNNYLGLATHPTVKNAAIAAIAEWGVGSGASRLISGSTAPHHSLEDCLASFKCTEAALTFGSGYMANIGLLPSLMKGNGLILADRLCHASLIDGCRLAKTDFRVFRHNDLAHLQQLLATRKRAQPILIVTEGVFSMDGDLAPLDEIHQLTQDYEADLLIDDAHGTGVMGPNGRGTLEHFGLAPESAYQMGTLSKAIGTSGGYIVGSQSLKEFLINTARSLMYTTAPPPAIAAAATAALTIIQQEPERRTRLWQNRERLFTGLTSMGYTFTDTQSPILPVLMKNAQQAMEMSDSLFKLGVYVPAIRPPTVPKESCRLRLTVTSETTLSQTENVLTAFRTAGKALHLI
ncbi:MAG: 8-amino-7-oxononanoate synthase [Nitrospirales bacterium]|nr:8-amino-7-oxononanoate synthase [Nitrospirales bacterium]